MCAAANERDDKAKGNIRTDYLRGFQSSEAEQRRRAQSAGSCGGKADLGAYRKHQP